MTKWLPATGQQFSSPPLSASTGPCAAPSISSGSVTTAGRAVGDSSSLMPHCSRCSWHSPSRTPQWRSVSSKIHGQRWSMRILRAPSALLLFSLCAWADVTGTITGVVTDPTGAVVPNSEIVALNTGTNARFRAMSDAQGVYFLRSLPVGVYNLAVTHPCFRNCETKDVRLQFNEVVRVDVALAVGETSDAVTVAGEIVHVDTTTATLRTVVDQKRIEDLPLNGRSPTQLMRLV